MASPCHLPENLEPSELGTKQYWDAYYEGDLTSLRDDEADEDEAESVTNLSTWFDDVNAPHKILKFLTSQEFPLAPCNFPSDLSHECPSVLDLGTGNGQTLFQLRLQGKFKGQMVGVDYSRASVRLAQELGKNREGCEDIRFERMDVIRDDPSKQEWWHEDGFDLVLDKGTFDAISLSDEVIGSLGGDGLQAGQAPDRVHTLYPSRAFNMVKSGGFLLVTSCNWTQEELIHWFTAGMTGSNHGTSVWERIEYPRFKFGGQEGQGLCTVCFRKDFAPKDE